MADDTQTGGQAPQGQQSQAGNAPTSSTPEPQQQQQASTTPQAGAESGQQQQQSQQNSQPSLEELVAAKERLERELAETRKEAAAHRVKAKELDKRMADEEAAKLSDVEKAQKRAEAAEAREKTTRERIARSELKLAAKDAGIIDPEDAIAFLLGKVEYDDDGEPKDVAQLVEGLKKSKAHLFGSAGTPASQQRQEPASSGGATNPPRQSGPVVVTADQYLNKEFQRTFRAQHGIDIVAAARQGKVTIV